MPFCASCGTQATGAFCPKCGAPVAAGAAPPQQGASAPPPMTGAPPIEDNVASALCYALGFVTGVIFLVLEPYNRNKAIRFHAFQSIFLSVAVIVIRIVLAIAFGILFRVAGLWSISLLVWPLFLLLCLGIWLYMMFQAYQGKTVVLPVIGPIAEQQAQAFSGGR